MPGARLDAVLPLAAADADRAQILFRSLETFFDPLSTCWVVAPDDDVGTVRRHVPRDRYAVVPESEVIPEIGYFRRTAAIRTKLHLVGPPIHGWFVQQLVKLAIAARVQTRFYLTLDADVVCVRPTSYEDLVRDDRALVQLSPPNHPEWNDDAERVLQLRRSGVQYGVTPALFAPEAVEALRRHLEGRGDPRLRRAAARLPGRAAAVAASWRSFLLRNLPWTEYALYHTFLERTGLAAKYHELAGEDAIYDNCVWMESQFEGWDPAGGRAAFSVVQSAARIPPEAVLSKVDPYVEAFRSRPGATSPLPTSAS